MEIRKRTVGRRSNHGPRNNDYETSEYGIVEFRQCACSCWPVFSPNYWGLGRCGICKEYALFPAATPPDGKYHKLEDL